jgi:hypothetical protein
LNTRIQLQSPHDGSFNMLHGGADAVDVYAPVAILPPISEELTEDVIDATLNRTDIPNELREVLEDSRDSRASQGLYMNPVLAAIEQHAAYSSQPVAQLPVPLSPTMKQALPQVAVPLGAIPTLPASHTAVISNFRLPGTLRKATIHK